MGHLLNAFDAKRNTYGEHIANMCHTYNVLSIPSLEIKWYGDHNADTQYTYDVISFFDVEWKWYGEHFPDLCHAYDIISIFAIKRNTCHHVAYKLS